jgi:hypothetical protein
MASSSNINETCSKSEFTSVSKVIISTKTIPTAEQPILTNGHHHHHHNNDQVQQDESNRSSHKTVIPHVETKSEASAAAADSINVPTTTTPTPTLTDEMEDELSKLNCGPLGGSDLVRQKSATLTPTSGGNDDTISGGGSSSMMSSPHHRHRNSSPNAFMNSARNNLRRSFTLPRGLLLRKSGQTGPASENQNGNFVRNIFLTLVRSKSVRKKSSSISTNNKAGDINNEPFEMAKNGDSSSDAVLNNKLIGDNNK